MAAKRVRTGGAEVKRRREVRLVAPTPRTFIDEAHRERESDCICHLPYRPRDGSSEREVWVYILIEHQSAPDRWVPFRLLLSIARLWEGERRERVSAAERFADAPWHVRQQRQVRRSAAVHGHEDKPGVPGLLAQGYQGRRYLSAG